MPDRIHHLDLGLFRYQIEYIYELLKLQHGNMLVEEVDRRLSAIPRYPGLKIFSNGLQSIVRLIANEYRSLMKIMLFVIDNLYDNYQKEKIPCKRLCNIFNIYLDMYMMLRQESFTDMRLAEL